MNSTTLVDITKSLKTSISEKANDQEVLKTNVQSLTAEQKAQVAKNLDNFLTKSGATGISGSYCMSPTSNGIAIGADWDTKAGAIIDLQSNVDWRKGSWLLHARNPQHQSVLEGTAEGSIIWNGQSVVTSLIAKKIVRMTLLDLTMDYR